MTAREARKQRAEEWAAWKPGTALPSWAAANESQADVRQVADALATDLLASLAELEAAEARLRNLEAERRIGRTPNVCRNDDCGTISYGVGYSCCPGCGGTDGHIGNETRA